MRSNDPSGLKESRHLAMKSTPARALAGWAAGGISPGFYFLLLSLVMLPVEPLRSESGNPFTCLTNVQQVRELDPETAGKNLPVRISGVVTYYDATLFNLFIQDATTGIFVL